MVLVVFAAWLTLGQSSSVTSGCSNRESVERIARDCFPKAVLDGSLMTSAMVRTIEAVPPVTRGL